MSAGYVHTKASLMLAGGFVLGTVISWDITNLQYVAGSLIGVMITPDLDVDAGFSGDKYIRNSLGWFAERIWKVIWYFYRRSLKHGGELSHFPIISTIGRILYLFGLFIVLPHVIYYWIFQPTWDLRYVLEWYFDGILSGWRIVVGLIGSDVIHWSLDVSTTEHKKKE